MKNLLLITGLLTIAFNSNANCVLDVKVKKQSSKTYYLASGERLSESIVKRLSSVCKINRSVMSERELRLMKVKELEMKIAKAKAKAKLK